MNLENFEKITIEIFRFYKQICDETDVKNLHYLMSDIHGDWFRFNQMMRKIQFSNEDFLYVVGDIVDCGPENLKLLYQLRYDPRICVIKGNHELFAQMYLEGTLDGWQWDMWGGAVTRQEIDQLSMRNKDDLLDYLSNLPLYYPVRWGQTECVLTHSGYHADYPVYNQDGTINVKESIYEAASNSEFDYLISLDLHHIPARLEFDLYLIVGHYPIGLYNHRNGKIYRNRRYIDLDCGNSYREEGGKLGCLRMEDGQEFYI